MYFPSKSCGRCLGGLPILIHTHTGISWNLWFRLAGNKERNYAFCTCWTFSGKTFAKWVSSSQKTKNTVVFQMFQSRWQVYLNKFGALYGPSNQITIYSETTVKSMLIHGLGRYIAVKQGRLCLLSECTVKQRQTWGHFSRKDSVMMFEEPH